MSMLVPALCVVFAGSLMACSVPVFRYAIEHWRPDPYVAVVFHRGGLSESQQSLVAGLQLNGDDASSAANLEVKTVDLDGDPDDGMAKIWEEQETESLPWLVLKAPAKGGPPATVWAGELSDDSTSHLVTSPVRDELKQRLLNGDSIVWVFLDSGQQQADDAAYEVVQTESERLEQVLELPEIEEADVDDLSVDPSALTLKMSSLRVSRDDPAERFLVDMLLRVEPDLAEPPFVDQPMAFPVFGRGRALYALVGNGITPQTIEEACRFLTGACQCTVKEQNPGVDLLIAVDWDQFIEPIIPIDTTAPALTGLTAFAEPQGAAATDAAGDQAAGETAADSSHSPHGIAGTGAVAQDEHPPSDARADTKSSLTPTADSAAGTVVEPQGAGALTGASTDASTGSSTGSSTGAAAPSAGIAGNVLLMMGLLTMCVIVVSMVFIPRSK